jgi:hypothetical protein
MYYCGPQKEKINPITLMKEQCFAGSFMKTVRSLGDLK